MRSEEEEGLSVSLHGEQGNVYKLSYHRCHYPAASAIVAKLTQVDALPCAEVQTAVGDGDAEADSRETAFGMSRHVVVALEGVVIIRFAFAHEVVVYGLHVVTHIGSAFSLMLRAQLVCLMKRFSNPASGSGWGRWRVTSSVIR